MKIWKVGLLILIIIIFSVTIIQFFTIKKLQMQNSEMSDLLHRTEIDLNIIRESLLFSNTKDNLIARIRKDHPKFELFEYDLGQVKMRALNLNFAKDGKIVSISIQKY